MELRQVWTEEVGTVVGDGERVGFGNGGNGPRTPEFRTSTSQVDAVGEAESQVVPNQCLSGARAEAENHFVSVILTGSRTREGDIFLAEFYNEVNFVGMHVERTKVHP